MLPRPIRSSGLLLNLAEVAGATFEELVPTIHRMMGEKSATFVHVVILDPDIRRESINGIYTAILAQRSFGGGSDEQVEDLARWAALSALETRRSLLLMLEDSPYLVTDDDPLPELGCGSSVHSGGLIVACAGMVASECEGLARLVANVMTRRCRDAVKSKHAEKLRISAKSSK